ncbi:MAG TPA: hypothetical protein VFT51_11070 [Bacillales bacterium]|nr:hypothetical protein [Bacillales bacterium]
MTDEQFGQLMNGMIEMKELQIKMGREMTEMKDELRQEMSDMKKELRGEMSDMKQELRGEMSDMKQELNEKIDNLGGDITLLAKKQWENERSIHRLQKILF